MSIAVFPGSFDPVTKGHLDLIKRASMMFDKLVIGVLINSAKKPLFSIQERVEMLKELTDDLENVSVESFDGLLVDFVEMMNADVIVRGLRTAQDFEYELPMAQINQRLNPETQTIFLAASPEYSYVSSSAVKELASFGGDYKDMLPEAAYLAVKTKENETKVEDR